MSKVKVDVLKPWITKRTTEMLKIEDDVVLEFIFNQLEEKSFNNRSSAAQSFFLWSLTLLWRIQIHLLGTVLLPMWTNMKDYYRRCSWTLLAKLKDCFTTRRSTKNE